MADRPIFGYHGRILEVDLTRGDVRSLPLDPDTARDYLGGRGLATRLFCDRVDPGCDPLSPENVLVLAASPVIGTAAPTACRGHMVFKSPLTGFIGSANCGGSFAPVFKAAGYDALVIRGRASSPVRLHVTPEQAELRPAEELWGLDVHETNDRLLEGDTKRRVLCIGPAGERLVRIASVMNDKNRAYGRGGPGAVFGSKHLKAVVVSGGEKTEIKDPEQFRSGLEQSRYLLKSAPVTKRLLRELGTAGLVKLIDLIEMLPHNNFQDNLHDAEGLERICGEAIRDTILEKAGACYRCPMACQRHTRVGRRKGEGPEYETTVLLGPCCGVYDLPAVTLANYACNELGMDTISCGAVIACAMELFEKGALPPEEADGFELRFGNAGVLEALARRTAYREGIGDRLAEGSARLAARYGRPELAMAVKGLEFPAYDPRASYTQALGYATSPTGACHLRGGYAVSLAFFGGAKEIPRFSAFQSPISIRNMQNLGIIQDSLGICRFTGYAFGTEPWSRMVSGITGEVFSAARLEEAADRIAALERLFNLSAGAARADDTLPPRFLEEPIPVGGKDRVVPRETLEKMITDYYGLQGWDEEGRPKPFLLEHLGIHEVEPTC